MLRNFIRWIRKTLLKKSHVSDFDAELLYLKKQAILDRDESFESHKGILSDW